MKNSHVRIGINNINVNMIESLIIDGLKDLKGIDRELNTQNIRLISEMVIDKLHQVSTQKNEFIFHYKEFEDLGWIHSSYDSFDMCHVYNKGLASILVYDYGKILTNDDSRIKKEIESMSGLVNYDKEINLKRKRR